MTKGEMLSVFLRRVVPETSPEFVRYRRGRRKNQVFPGISCVFMDGTLVFCYCFASIWMVLMSFFLPLPPVIVFLPTLPFGGVFSGTNFGQEWGRFVMLILCGISCNFYLKPPWPKVLFVLALRFQSSSFLRVDLTDRRVFGEEL